MNELKIMIFHFMAIRKKSGLVPPTLHYCGHNAKKSEQKNLCWKFARCVHLSAALRWYFNIQIIRNLWWFIIYKPNLVCFSLSFIQEIFENISICRQAHYLTQRFSLTGRPCIRISSFSAMLIQSIVWGWTSNSYVKPIMIQLKRIIRTICNSSRLEHTTPFFSNLKIIKVSGYVYVFDMCLYAKIHSSGKLCNESPCKY